MTVLTFETLLAQAETDARASDWGSALTQLQAACQIEPEHAGALTGIGTCLLQLQRTGEALPYFRKVVDLEPESAEALNNLGVVLALLGQVETALEAYQQAVDLDPEHVQAWKNLALVSLQSGRSAQGAQILAALVQSHPQDVEALILLAECYEGGEDPVSARTLYAEALKHQPDHPAARQALARLASPGAGDPARIARPEHARKLASLKSLKGSSSSAVAEARPGADQTIILYGPPEAATELRLAPVARALAESGRRVRVSARPEPADTTDGAVFVISRPHASPDLMDALHRCIAAGKLVVIDLDEDFLHLPSEHPQSAVLNTHQARTELTEALQTAAAVTVPCPALAAAYKGMARRVETIPSAWDQSNPLWDKPTPRRATFNVGLVGLHVLPKDLMGIKAELARFLREVPQALVVAAQDLRLYEALDPVPEDRRLFLPAGRLEDYPFLLANFDILLVPWQNSPYHRAGSDQPLLEAGARRIPWVAAPVPAFQDWAVGGLFAEKNGGWHDALKRLAEDAALRAELGEAGRRKAEERSVKVSAGRWLKLFDEL